MTAMFYIPADEHPQDPNAWGAVIVGWNGSHNVLTMWDFDFAPLVEEFECWPAILDLICREIQQDPVEAFAALTHAIEVQDWVARGFDEGHADHWPAGECPSIEAIKAAMLVKHTKNVKRRATGERRREFGRERSRLVLSLIDAGHVYECAVSECRAVHDLTVDHKLPLSRGGSDEIENLQFLCRSHNSAKGDRQAGGLDQ